MLGMTKRLDFLGYALGLIAWAGSAGAPFAAAAAPSVPVPAQLKCQVTYAGATHTVLAEPVQDPYLVPSVDIRGRFRFKPVVVGAGQRVDRVLIYAYWVDGEQALLMHQAKFLPPFPLSPQPLTGQQHLYAGPLERELMYSCSLNGGAP